MDFACFSLSPIALAHPGLAVATSRAGGVGFLDVEFCRVTDLDRALKNVNQLLERIDPKNAVGLRLVANQMDTHRSLLESLSHRSHWLILSGWEFSLEAAIAALPYSSSRHLLLEITQIDRAIGLENQGVKVDGLVARGHESGGWVGEDSAFILTQKLLAKQSYPVYVQGGIGIHTAAAVRAAGAAGVVLDDQLWLMPESPLPKEWQLYLNNLSGQEAIVIGERLQASCRVLSHPLFKVTAELQQLANQIELTETSLKVATARWQHQVSALMDWASPDRCVWPMGQGVGLAAQFRDRFQTTGKLVQAILNTSATHLKTASRLRPLDSDAPLARSHRTQMPIVQGPMTRVSDMASFAQAVAQAGGLPMLALALMRSEQVRTLLQQTQKLLGSHSWGIGILGFVPQALREEQLTAVMEIKPPFALIAGGRPDQAKRLEAEGIATYIHVPTPRLLHLFIEQGARRFVFEGRECGGHVGPLSSFVLWETTIDTLLSVVPAGVESDIHILFAGGIHDARSAAMVSAMAAPLVERGMKIGVLMGTAYLFTEEVVNCGAILPEFQQVAINCSRTINLETGPGHASRCAVTPFAKEFYQARAQMMRDRHSSEEVRNTLEDLTLGRLRIASKGLTRDEGGKLVSVDPQEQLVQGMYMIGQVATLRDRVCTIAELHQEVSELSADLLEKACISVKPETQTSNIKPSDIAIVGMGTLLPQAQHPEKYWRNILDKVNAITEIPPHRWDWRLYYDSDRTARDKVYSKWGGFLDDVAFDPVRFGIPPKSLKSIEPLQLLTLEVVRQALEDAGYSSGNFDREHTCVILGAGGGIADLGQQYAVRAEIPRFVDAPSEQIWERLPEWTEESFPGLLLNVAAGRVANRFDLGGSNFTVDAACASSLAAIDLAVKELESGRANVAIAGGIDTVQSPFAYLCFSKTQALTPTGGPRPFDKSADGIAISEGLAVVVLKRLADAERDGDRIYAVIKAVEGSSDGKALGMTAPLPAGQRRAVERAYQKAGFEPSTLGIYEAHGTGTAAGDRAELETITSTLMAAKAASNSCALGSVKSLIGHTKCTAGVAGLIKVALALYHKVIPGHAGVEDPLEPIADPSSPVYLLKEAHPWLGNAVFPRRGAVSAFGFGGTNFHAVLEEHLSAVPDRCLGATQWPCELFVWQSETEDALIEELRSLVEALEAGAQARLQDLAYTCAKLAQERGQLPVTLALVSEDLEQLKCDLILVIDHLQTQPLTSLPDRIRLKVENQKIANDSSSEIQNPKSKILSCEGGHRDGNRQDAHFAQNPKSKIGSIAFVFPGQGCQYPDMVREVALYFREIRQAIELASRQLQPLLNKPISQSIYPPSPYSPHQETQNKEQLMDTQIAQPAMGAIEMGFMDLMQRLGLEPAMVCGHSYGEYAALYCAGVLSRQDFLNLSATRGRVMATACAASDGAMAAVQETRENLQNHLAGINGVAIANYNAPKQTVISGEKKIVNQVVDNLNAAGVMARMLPVAGAFHSALVASAKTALASAIASVTIHPPKIPVYANSTTRPYPPEVDSIRHQLTEHLVNPIDFVGQINAMYAAGARIIVELGPKQVLTGLIGQILAGKAHTVVSLDGQGGGMRGFLMALAALVTAAAGPKLTALFEDRDVRLLDMSRLVELTRKPPLPSTACLVHGGGVRTQSESVAYTGKLPPLNLETADRAKNSIGQVKNHESKNGNSAPKFNNNLHSPPAQIPHPVPITAAPILKESTAEAPAKIEIPNSIKAKETREQSSSFIQTAVDQTNSIATRSQPAIAPSLPLSDALTNNKDSRSMNHSELSGANSTTPSSNSKNSQNTGISASTHYGRPPIGPEVALAAYQAYQETMRQFLVVQEQVMKQFLGGSVYPSTVSQLPTTSNPSLALPLPTPSVNGSYPQQETVTPPIRTDRSEPHSASSTTNGKGIPGAPISVSVPPAVTPAALVQSAQIPSALPTPHSALSTPHSPLSTDSVLPDRFNLTRILLQIVSDRTGYPVEMLDLDRDIEAELGIDSIKRVEILGALQKQLPPDRALTVQSQMETLTRVKSLNKLIEQLLSVIANTQEVTLLGKR